jgi:hypothetical protein
MARDPDEDALSWGDDGDPTYLDSPADVRSSQRSDAISEVDVAGRTSATSTTPSESTAAESTASESTASESTASQQSRPSLAERRAQAATPSAETDGTTEGTTDETTDGTTGVDADIAVADEPQGMSSVMLLTLGVLAGVYLLYTVGWFTSATRTIAVPIGALDAVMAKVREYLSIAAPALWFGGTLLLTRNRKSSTRVLMLLLGAIVLLPLPFVLGV